VKVFTRYKRAVGARGGADGGAGDDGKGFGMAAAASRNATHSEKKLTDEGLAAFVKRFNIPIPEEQAAGGDAVPSAAESPEMVYMQERRRRSGRSDADAVRCRAGLSRRRDWIISASGQQGPMDAPCRRRWDSVSVLRHLLKECRDRAASGADCSGRGTDVGMESVFRQVGTTRRRGSDIRRTTRRCCCLYREELDGQILEEGITEAGAMASFTAAGQAYSTYKMPMIPVLHVLLDVRIPENRGPGVGVCGRARTGIHDGGTAGRTTMLGEGLQHQDGHSHVLASTIRPA